MVVKSTLLALQNKRDKRMYTVTGTFATLRNVWKSSLLSQSTKHRLRILEFDSSFCYKQDVFKARCLH